jgi:hypothetical protein
LQQWSRSVTDLQWRGSGRSLLVDGRTGIYKHGYGTGRSVSEHGRDLYGNQYDSGSRRVRSSYSNLTHNHHDTADSDNIIYRITVVQHSRSSECDVDRDTWRSIQCSAGRIEHQCGNRSYHTGDEHRRDLYGHLYNSSGRRVRSSDGNNISNSHGTSDSDDLICRQSVLQQCCWRTGSNTYWNLRRHVQCIAGRTHAGWSYGSSDAIDEPSRQLYGYLHDSGSRRLRGSDGDGTGNGDDTSCSDIQLLRYTILQQWSRSFTDLQRRWRGRCLLVDGRTGVCKHSYGTGRSVAEYSGNIYSNQYNSSSRGLRGSDGDITDHHHGLTCSDIQLCSDAVLQ